MPEVTEYLGKHVKDAISKFEGICTSVLIQSNGNLMIGIQPSQSDNEKKDPLFFDRNIIDILGDGHSDRVIFIESEFKIGDKVKHTVSGFTGVVTATTYFMSGCAQHTVHGDKLSKEGGMFHDYFLDTYLEKIGEHKTLQEKPKTRTGGPNQTVRRIL